MDFAFSYPAPFGAAEKLVRFSGLYEPDLQAFYRVAGGSA
jgi:hypothetical protein